MYSKDEEKTLTFVHEGLNPTELFSQTQTDHIISFPKL